MTSKENFLRNIGAKIQALKSELAKLENAYKVNSEISDEVFNMMFGEGAPIKEEVVRQERTQYQAPADTSEYGAIKKLVLQIIKNGGRAISKRKIVGRYASMIHSNKDETNAVTNALSALLKDRIIISYRYDQIRIKGKFWALRDWMSPTEDNVKMPYRPNPDEYVDTEDDE